MARRAVGMCDGWGADVIFECSGDPRATKDMFEMLCPGGRVVFVGIPNEPVCYDVVAAQVKEARVEHVFRYAHVFERALALMSGGRIDVKSLIGASFPFEHAVEAFGAAIDLPAAAKVQIELPQ